MDSLVISKRLWMSGIAWHRWLAIRRNHTINRKAKNHYEVLGLNKDCTQEEVKRKYLALSQEHHPDKKLANEDPNNPDHHNRFVEINEAYSILQKAYTRSVYDSHLKDLERGPRGGFTREYGGIRTDAPREKVVFYDESIYNMRDRSKDASYANKPYYWGMPKVRQGEISHAQIFAASVLFMVVGAIVQFIIVKVSSDHARVYLDERDMVASINYSQARDRAKLGNEQAMERLRKKVEAEKLLFEGERNKKSTENDGISTGAETDSLQKVPPKSSFQVQATIFAHQRKTEPEFNQPYENYK